VIHAPTSERRLVSVLFVDLVGFTSASEARDAEDTREFLTRYFEIARTTIERYGGTVEKFIGDAVMAVWGAPVAQEDDAGAGSRRGRPGQHGLTDPERCRAWRSPSGSRRSSLPTPRSRSPTTTPASTR
jgi:class 3 adenylate cyclase